MINVLVATYGASAFASYVAFAAIAAVGGVVSVIAGNSTRN